MPQTSRRMTQESKGTLRTPDCTICKVGHWPFGAKGSKNNARGKLASLVRGVWGEVSGTVEAHDAAQWSPKGAEIEAGTSEPPERATTVGTSLSARQRSGTTLSHG